MSENGIPLADAVIPRVEKAMPTDFPSEPFLGLDDIEAHTTRLLGYKPSESMKSAAKRFYPGDVLYSRLRPYLNKVWLADRTGLCSSEFIVLPSNENVDGAFLKYRLNAMDFVSFANSLNAGDRPRVDFDQIGPFQLPPFSASYQKRIVAKIEELFSELEAGEASLRKARRQLGVYRQSLLKQAFEGKLTAKWRTQNPDKLAEWSWLTLQDIADVTGGLTKNSKRDSLPTRIPYLRVANVYANELRLDEIKDIGVTTAEADKVRLMKGDLLIVEGNGSLDQIGRVALWNGSISNCGHQNHLIRARCRAMAHPAFVLMFLLSPLGRDAIEKQAASTSGLHTLSVSKVQRLPVPLCSLPEQQKIVRILDEQFEAIERNERELDAALKRSETLRQSILKRAFSGRLVPQDPADEPAPALLARLRVERSNTSSSSASSSSSSSASASSSTNSLRRRRALP